MRETAESQPVGLAQDEEFWNTYQGLQEQLSGNTHKESEPVCERGKAHHDNSLIGIYDKSLLNQNIVGIFWVPSYVDGRIQPRSNYDVP